MNDRTQEIKQRAAEIAAEFAEVNGVGAAKLKDFAAPFLDAIATARFREHPSGRGGVG